MSPELEHVWSAVLDRLTDPDLASDDNPALSRQQQAWLRLVQPIAVVNGFAMLAAPSAFARDNIESVLRGPITRALSSQLGEPVDLAVKVDTSLAGAQQPTDDAGEPDIDVDEIHRPEPEDEVTPSAPRPTRMTEEQIAAERLLHGSDRDEALSAATAPGLNERYTFSAFVQGNSNRFARAAALAVAEAPARAYNPLFIWGESGLGKTHLLHAIGHYARDLRSGMKVRYISSEEMTNEFVNSVRDGRGEQFKRRYRNLDMLIVDDVQFLQGKESTQEEFFHTFNALYQANHQIVLSSDRPPSQLTTLEDRLRTRFEGGLTTDVKTPDLETRMAILAKKSLLNGAEVPRDVLEFIASRNESSIRELEGALTRVVAYCSMTGEPITIAAAEVVVKDILPQDVKITPEMVIEVIADHFTVSIDQLTGPSKVRKIVTARQFGMFLTREYCEMSTTKIGEVYGGRDHTTVMHAEKKMRTAIQENTAIFEQFQELTQKIKSRARQR